MSLKINEKLFLCVVLMCAGTAQQQIIKENYRVMTRLTLLCLVSILVSNIQASPMFFDRESDSLQLVDLYNSTEGDSWFDSWDLSMPMDTWQGISLDADGNVLAVNLFGNNLKGALPSLRLPECRTLNLQDNQLRDTFPNLNGMRKMQFLDLSGNTIDGSLYDFNLPELQTIDLSNNSLQGQIPNFSGITQLTSLRLNNNRLTGSIPDFDNLPTLFTLDLSNNRLEGIIPDFDLPNLLTLRLGDNELINNLPSFGNMRFLFTLDVSNNNLTGFLPVFSRLIQLENLNISGNRFTGPLSSFGNLNTMESLDLSDNLLEGSLQNLNFYDQLSYLDVSGNNLSGSVPTFDDNPFLQQIILSKNNFSDTLPDLSHLLNLVELHVDSNNLSHSNFDVADAQNLEVLRIQGNRFTFEDLDKINAGTLTSYIYAPQQRIPMPDTIFATIGENVLIDLVVDNSIPDNTYQWFFNEAFDLATAVNEYTIPSINALDVGIYYAIAKNNRWPALSLFSEEVLVLMDCPINEVPVVDSICAGDTLFVNGVGYTETGEYIDTLIVNDPTTCDSVFMISLTVHPVYDTTVFDTICASEVYDFNGSMLDSTGLYVDTLMSQFGCDSIVRLQLKVNEVYSSISVKRICAGDTVFVGPIAHTVSGIFFDTLQTQFGCDSVIISEITVVDTFLSVTEVSLCFGETYEWRGQVYAESGEYVESLLNTDNCDSTYVLRLEIPDTQDFFITRTICSADSVQIGDTSYNMPGTYIDTLMGSDGCDSIVHLTLQVVDDYNQEFDLTLCTGDTLFFMDQAITATGIYIDSLEAQGGCDSIVKIRLTVADFIVDTIQAILCPGDSIVVGDNVYREVGNYLDTIVAPGCDTIIRTQIAVAAGIELDSVQLRLKNNNIGSITPFISGGNGVLSYLWSTGSTQIQLDSIGAGDYALAVQDELGCTVSYDFVLDQTTDTRDARNLKADVKVYPNPTRVNNLINVELFGLEAGRYEIELYDLFGRRVKSKIHDHQTNDVLMDRLESPGTGGIYHIRVSNETGQFLSHRIMVH